MAGSQPNAHQYTAGTERALYAFSNTRCYFPDCTTPVIKFVGDEPVNNVQIAHIRGAKPNSPRYDPAMSDDQRRAFSNLILLCTPHHTVVDRLHPDDYSVETLEQWKAARESAAGIDNDALSSLSDDQLFEKIEAAVRSASPQRTVVAELGIGFVTARETVQLPTETAVDHLPNYAHLGPAVMMVTVRNQGSLKAFVNSRCIRLTPSSTAFTIDEFPGLHPALPAELDVGESKTWFYHIATVINLIQTTRAVWPDGAAFVVGEVCLGSGETVTSDQLSVELLGATDATTQL